MVSLLTDENGFTQQFSQWVYIQRGLRIFDGSKVHIYKVPRLTNWTRTQALNDADDLIAEVLAAGMGKRWVAALHFLDSSSSICYTVNVHNRL